MRTVLSTLLLLTAFVFGQVSAVELTKEQVAALLVGLSQSNKSQMVTLSFGSAPSIITVAFTVTLDAVGNVIARPTPPSTLINQISIGTTLSGSGFLLPSTILVVNGDNSVVGYNVSASESSQISR